MNELIDRKWEEEQYRKALMWDIVFAVATFVAAISWQLGIIWLAFYLGFFKPEQPTVNVIVRDLYKGDLEQPARQK